MPGLILIGLPAAGVPFEEEDLALIERATPVDSGWLVSRWKIGAGGFSLENDADYAAYVEFAHHTRSGSVVPGQEFVLDSLPELYAQMEARNPYELENYDPLPGEFEIFVGY